MKEIYSLAIKFESAPHRAMVLDVTEPMDADDLSDFLVDLQVVMNLTKTESFQIVFNKEDWHGWQRESHPLRSLVADIDQVPLWVTALGTDSEWRAAITSFSEKEVSLLATHIAIMHKGHAFVVWKL